MAGQAVVATYEILAGHSDCTPCSIVSGLARLGRLSQHTDLFFAALLASLPDSDIATIEMTSLLV